jgi:hypothetical protein
MKGFCVVQLFYFRFKGVEKELVCAFGVWICRRKRFAAKATINLKTSRFVLRTEQAEYDML